MHLFLKKLRKGFLKKWDSLPNFRKFFSFIYKAELDNGLTEYEYDHVFIGTFDGTPDINQDEVEDWKFVKLEDLKLDIQEHPERYTKWFLICFPKIEQYVNQER
ncbi:MAG: NUDIX domain-containing protein [Sporocytophaga sp.]|nr:NUDIX domain-containing protein [Sporocytophaga sp.]